MYSNADMITNVVDDSGNVTKYEFDTLNRLTKEINGDNITSYKYDLAGNRTQKVKAVVEGDAVRTDSNISYTLGLGNRLASWGDNGEAHYNLAGCLTNMVSDVDGKELNLSWDERYQLTSVDSVSSNGVGGKVSYDYNVLGQRISRKEVSGNTTNIEYYVHSGVNIIADLDENKELLRSYSYAPGYDNIISMTTYGDSETNTYFYIRNHNNSVVALVDENGNIAESYTYTAYGEVTVFDSNGNELEQSALGNRYTFQGREIDYTTGLYNFRARWYDAETGRWLFKDPIGINGGLNQYVFCGNNPVMFVDPEGLDLDIKDWANWGRVGEGGLDVLQGAGTLGAAVYISAQTGGLGTVACWGVGLQGAYQIWIGAMKAIEGIQDPHQEENQYIFDASLVGFTILLATDSQKWRDRYVFGEDIALFLFTLKAPASVFERAFDTYMLIDASGEKIETELDLNNDKIKDYY